MNRLCLGVGLFVLMCGSCFGNEDQEYRPFAGSDPLVVYGENVVYEDGTAILRRSGETQDEYYQRTLSAKEMRDLKKQLRDVAVDLKPYYYGLHPYTLCTMFVGKHFFCLLTDRGYVTSFVLGSLPPKLDRLRKTMEEMEIGDGVAWAPDNFEVELLITDLKASDFPTEKERSRQMAKQPFPLPGTPSRWPTMLNQEDLSTWPESWPSWGSNRLVRSGDSISVFLGREEFESRFLKGRFPRAYHVPISTIDGRNSVICAVRNVGYAYPSSTVWHRASAADTAIRHREAERSFQEALEKLEQEKAKEINGPHHNLN